MKMQQHLLAKRAIQATQQSLMDGETPLSHTKTRSYSHKQVCWRAPHDTSKFASAQ